MRSSGDIEALARGNGVEIFGVADASGFLDEGYQGGRPHDIMPDVRSVIVIGVRVPRGCMEPLPKGRAEYTNTLLAGTVVLRSAAYRIAQMLEAEGEAASIIPVEGSEFGYWYADRETLKADMSTKYAARLAGLGSYGVSNLLLIPGFGPAYRMTAVITTAELECGRPADMLHDSCSDCLSCVEVCPADALHADGSIDRKACRDYMFTELGGLRCGLCVKACWENFQQR